MITLSVPTVSLERELQEVFVISFGKEAIMEIAMYIHILVMKSYPI